MSRGGFGGRGRGGRGGARTSFGGFEFSQLGTTYQEVMSIPREPSEKYPPLENPPFLGEISENERRAARYQHDLVERLQRSQYHLVEEFKTPDLVRYSDKYRPAVHAQLKESDLDPNFFPPDVWQRYFHPKIPVPAAQKLKRKKSKKANLDDIDADDGDEKEDEDEDDDEDAEMDEYEDEEDDDYAENYFETGSQEDQEEFGVDGGGGEDYD